MLEASVIQKELEDTGIRYVIFSLGSIASYFLELPELHLLE